MSTTVINTQHKLMTGQGTPVKKQMINQSHDKQGITWQTWNTTWTNQNVTNTWPNG